MARGSVEERQRLLDSSATPTPLPTARVAILMIVFFADSICLSFVLPIVPFMIKDFEGYSGAQEARIGFLSGWVCASYTLGQVLAAPFWGGLSDRIGRRPVILAGMLGNAVGVTAFGLAPSLPILIAVRFAQGLSSGNVPVARSYMADITDSSNEARAFAMIGAVFGLGGMLGPVLGGSLALPATQYPATFAATGLFGRFPFLLPCAVVAAFVLVDFVFALVMLSETGTERAAKEGRVAGREKEGRVAGTDAAVVAEAEAAAAAAAQAPLKPATAAALLSSRRFRVICGVFFLFGLTFIAFQEVFPMYVLTY